MDGALGSAWSSLRVHAYRWEGDKVGEERRREIEGENDRQGRVIKEGEQKEKTGKERRGTKNVLMDYHAGQHVPPTHSLRRCHASGLV